MEFFLFFPSGGVEQGGDPFEFYLGASYILEKMDPNTMAYSFCINPHDFALATKGHRKFLPSRPLMAAANVLGGLPNINKLRTPNVVKVSENYSTAQDWQNLISNKKSADKTTALTKHFLEIHKGNP